MVAPHDAPPPDDDPMGPPKVSVEVYCLHCQCVYMSDEIRWKPDPDGPGGGWWVCPMDDCDGKGFTIDIFPTDPEVAKQFGVEYIDCPEEGDDDEEEDFLAEFEALEPHDETDESDSNDADRPPKLPRERPFFTDDDIPF